MLFLSAAASRRSLEVVDEVMSIVVPFGLSVKMIPCRPRLQRDPRRTCDGFRALGPEHDVEIAGPLGPGVIESGVSCGCGSTR
jgi:hypothetical protein